MSFPPAWRNQKARDTWSPARSLFERSLVDVLQTLSKLENHKQLNTYRETGINDRDAVALMGAHTVGRVVGFNFINKQTTEDNV